MKFLIFGLSLFASVALAQTRTYETTCRQGDCFKYGWVTQSKSYVLDTHCKDQNCTRYGWYSRANDKSTYDVSCRGMGCFIDGWTSKQVIKGRVYYDEATCRQSSCLKYGWTIKTGYDLLGGNVVCNKNDCSRYGGKAYWRGRPSRTKCYGNECYKYGWSLYVY
jgi:hypothetical protein